MASYKKKVIVASISLHVIALLGWFIYYIFYYVPNIDLSEKEQQAQNSSSKGGGSKNDSSKKEDEGEASQKKQLMSDSKVKNLIGKRLSEADKLSNAQKERKLNTTLEHNNISEKSKKDIAKFLEKATDTKVQKKAKNIIPTDLQPKEGDAENFNHENFTCHKTYYDKSLKKHVATFVDDKGRVLVVKEKSIIKFTRAQLKATMAYQQKIGKLLMKIAEGQVSYHKIVKSGDNYTFYLKGENGDMVPYVKHKSQMDEDDMRLYRVYSKGETDSGVKALIDFANQFNKDRVKQQEEKEAEKNVGEKKDDKEKSSTD